MGVGPLHIIDEVAEGNVERLPIGPCTHWKALPYSRRARRADVADSGRSSWGKAVNRVERYRTAAARRAVPTFGSPSPAFGRSHRRAVLALASPEQRLGGRFAVEPSRFSSALHWLWSSTSGAREGFSLFATVSDFLTPKCRSIRHCCRSVQRLEICDEVGALGVVLQTGVDHRRVRHHRTRIGEVFVQGGGVPGDV